MELEKLVKSSFEKFEPEVNPSVWQQLEQNLGNAPVSSDPSSIAGKTVVKSVISQVSPWIWLGGLITTAALIATIVLTSTKKNNHPTTTSTPALQEAPLGNAQNKQGSDAVNEPSSVASELKINSSESALNSNNKQQQVVAQEKEGNSSVTAIQPIIKSASANSATPENQLNSSKTTTEEKKISKNQQENQVIKNNVEPVNVMPMIILNADAGFAPLKVLALLNDEKLKGNWDFNDGQEGTSGSSTTHILTKPGTYTLTCMLGDKKIEKTIEVIGSVSTAFTPNGDGMNDEFFVESNQLEELTVKIVDRSGRKVFEITQPGQHWDGNDTEGKNLPSGTYFYNIFARSYNGQPINQKGTINIFR